MAQDLTNLMIQDLINLKIWLVNNYAFKKIDLKRNNSAISVGEDVLGIEGEQIMLNRGVSILFAGGGRNTDELTSNRFLIRIYKLDTAYPDIDFEKYLIKNYGEDAPKKMSLNYYHGNFEEKFHQCINFFEPILNDSFMKDILAGKTWSEDYHRHLWEGTER